MPMKNIEKINKPYDYEQEASAPSFLQRIRVIAGLNEPEDFGASPEDIYSIGEQDKRRRFGKVVGTVAVTASVLLGAHLFGKAIDNEHNRLEQPNETGVTQVEEGIPAAGDN